MASGTIKTNEFSTKETVYSGGFPTGGATITLSEDISKYKFALIRTTRTCYEVDLRLLRKDNSVPYNSYFSSAPTYYEAIQGNLEGARLTVSNAGLSGWSSSSLKVEVYK